MQTSLFNLHLVDLHIADAVTYLEDPPVTVQLNLLLEPVF